MKSNFQVKMHPDWVHEREELANKANWREAILSVVADVVSKKGHSLSNVGSGVHEIQLRPVNLEDSMSPIVSMSSYFTLGLTWLELAVWEANTKKPGTRMVRFGPDVGVVMTLVKVPNSDSTWTWYLVCRRKYQLAGSDLFFEFTRGWIKDATDEDRGRKLVERDYPGLTALAASVRVEHMGTPVWENNAEFANKISHDLVVITMTKHISKEDLQKLLVTERAKIEYPDSQEPERIDGIWLTTCPWVMEIHEAGKFLNAHLEGTAEKLAFFGENYSMNAWGRFLSRWSWQFPDLVPAKGAEL